jgi:uncharacterized protein (TIGR02466 family)
MDINIVDIFPTAVFSNIVEIENSVISDIIALCAKGKSNNFFTSNINHNLVSNDSFVFQTVLKNTGVPELIQQYIDAYIKHVYGENTELGVTQSWINVNPPGTSHHKHSHYNSIISGTLYIQTGDKSGYFKIYRPDSMFRHIRDTTKTFNRFNYEYFDFDPKPCQLLIFPSELYHSVDTNNSKFDRISISFNTFYKGAIGNEKTLTHIPR